jgi:hypothetical protein
MKTYTVSFNYGTDNRKTVQVEAVNALTAIALAFNGEMNNWCDEVGFWISCALSEG